MASFNFSMNQRSSLALILFSVASYRHRRMALRLCCECCPLLSPMSRDRAVPSAFFHLEAKGKYEYCSFSHAPTEGLLIFFLFSLGCLAMLLFELRLHEVVETASPIPGILDTETDGALVL